MTVGSLSLLLFSLEVALFFYLRRQLQGASLLGLDDPEIVEMLLMLRMARPEHVMLYVSLYVSGFYLCRMVSVLFPFLVGVQCLSLMMSVYLIRTVDSVK